ncbi:hypothetical protein [Halobacteriovorax marinus]|uniref:hypothetical protein n=1 Tax=Halobacteriovorax marinus TaxID=97084 RepID=UPI003A93C305
MYNNNKDTVTYRELMEEIEKNLEVEKMKKLIKYRHSTQFRFISFIFSLLLSIHIQIFLKKHSLVDFSTLVHWSSALLCAFLIYLVTFKVRMRLNIRGLIMLCLSIVLLSISLIAMFESLIDL